VHELHRQDTEHQLRVPKKEIILDLKGGAEMEWKYRAVVFDFDMTLADTEKIIVELLNRSARHFGYPAKPYDEVKHYVGNTHEVMMGKLTGVTDKEKMLVMREYYRGLSRQEVPERTRFFPGVEECLQLLRGEGIRLGILSLKLKELMLYPLNKYGLTDYFDCILGSEELNAPKPAPDGLWQMMEHLKVSRREILYIGDSLVDEETAYQAGVDFGAMLLGSTKKEDFQPKRVTEFFYSYGDFIEKYSKISKKTKIT
jgi:phosphoglycolate phosphatase